MRKRVGVLTELLPTHVFNSDMQATKRHIQNSKGVSCLDIFRKQECHIKVNWKAIGPNKNTNRNSIYKALQWCDYFRYGNTSYRKPAIKSSEKDLGAFLQVSADGNTYIIFCKSTLFDFLTAQMKTISINSFQRINGKHTSLVKHHSSLHLEVGTGVKVTKYLRIVVTFYFQPWIKRYKFD